MLCNMVVANSTLNLLTASPIGKRATPLILELINMKTHWFYIHSKLLTIYTYGSGDHPTKTYLFEDVEEFNNKINQLKNDGYRFIKDQAHK